VGLWLSRAGLWGAGDQPCWGISGAEADSPVGLKWGPGTWAGRWEPQEMQGRDIQDWWCPDRTPSWCSRDNKRF